MRALAFVALAAWSISCYGPHVGDCQYACDNGACPSGTACNADGMCSIGGGACGVAGSDAGGGDGTTDPSRVDCGGSIGVVPRVPNLDICDVLTKHAADRNLNWTIESNVTLDATNVPPTNPDIGAGVQLVADKTAATTADDPYYYLVGDTVVIDGTLAITGSFPVIIVANTIHVNGDISAQQTESAMCATDGGRGGDGHIGGVASDSGGGGGGADGSETSNAGDAGIAFGVTKLSPLQGGCNGGRGGAPQADSTSTAAGGLAGGAIELVAFDAMTVQGQIRANGTSGGTGVMNGGGGGGGGSGGAILLQAPMITFAAGSALCANGGAGGGTNGAPSLVTCDATPSPGGTGGGGGTSGDGGNGGAGTTAPGRGQDGVIGLPGAGGGGGAVGRIHFIGILDNEGVTFSPPPQ